MHEKLKSFVYTLGFDSDSDFTLEENLSAALGFQSIFRYSIQDLIKIYFLYLPENNFQDSLLRTHQIIWNDNKTEVFIIISDYQTFLCASKYKPEEQAPKKCILDSFDYGVNSPEFPPDKIKQLFKEKIDYGFFWEFVRQKLKENRRKAVDDDLLLNLVYLKHDLKGYVADDKIYILIERCLFLKFLEDRYFLLPHTLLEILKNRNAALLVEKFNDVNNLLNGDIFDEKGFSSRDFLKPDEALSRLYTFFTTDYRNQIQLFPYNFSILPIELLSNIYEAFLRTETQIANGIYYTPSILVDLILDETLTSSLETKPLPTCLDFSCGSGIFLVKAYERLISHHKSHSNFETKKKILKNCIFGIEKDDTAARIAIFSLYLKLFEGENAEEIRNLIQTNEIKFPRLLNKNIQCKNTLFDRITFKNEDGEEFKKFDVLVGNPPWGVNPFKDPSLPEDAEMQLSKDKQDAVTPFQSSQYFTLKAQDFMKESAIAGILTNNSNLLTGKSASFRRKLLQEYAVNKIYDFKACNSILFEKRKLKMTRGSNKKSLKIELGADEPAVALVLQTKKQPTYSIEYIAPSLNNLTKFLKFIWIKPSDTKNISNQLLEENLLWRILAANGDIEDYSLIQKINQQKGYSDIKGYYGIRFKTNGEPIWKNIQYLDKDCIDHFVLKNPKTITQEGKSIRRPGKYYPKQLLIHRYVKKNLRVKAAYDHNGLPFQDNLIGIQLINQDYKFIISLFNSSLISYFLFFNSAQIGKGTFNMLHKNELESIPVPPDENLSIDLVFKLNSIIRQIEKSEVSHKMLSQIDEIMFEIFHLKDFEKQRVRDFFDVGERENTLLEFVNRDDFFNYAQRFRNVFTFILKDDKFLNAEAFVSSLIGAGITFTIVDMEYKEEKVYLNSTSDLSKIIPHIAKRQLQQSEKLSFLKQEKLKLYTTNSFTILKSNYYKDWTETEAIKDAKEEIELFVQHLPES